ncbi:hypothetical protein Tsubulata_002389 [Turnera subulata]|uniref:DUF4283 domain-containing protein n=1 Tax=Turnera subulata TaxID=218843 RepID=A0A9Q0G5I8_9ROSI|nr:hypothetical protein Tsubulata_002389 [Turnera subulata]
MALEPPPLDPFTLPSSYHPPFSLNLHEGRDAGRLRSKHVLLARLIAERRISSYVLKSICSKSWEFNNCLDVKEICHNTYLLSFEDEDDRSRILLQSPWTMSGNHVVIKEWPCNWALHEIDFSTFEFWVQVHGLTPSQFSKENGHRIGNMLGSCCLVDTFENNRLTYGNVMHLHVFIDVTIPIQPGFMSNHKNGDPSWIPFIYEKMADFSYNCGRLDHRERSCKLPLLPPCRPFTPGRYGLLMNAETGYVRWFFYKHDWESPRTAAVRDPPPTPPALSADKVPEQYFPAATDPIVPRDSLNDDPTVHKQLVESWFDNLTSQCPPGDVEMTHALPSSDNLDHGGDWHQDPPSDGLVDIHTMSFSSP